MQAREQLFAALEADRLRDADQLADELRDASDEREKKAIGRQIFQAIRMFQAFAKPQSVEIVRELRRFPLEQIKGVAFPIFANISFPSNIRSPSLPNFFRHAPFQEEFGNFFHEVHEATKLKSKARK